MIDKEVEDFLEHFGVKGMRWGVRNDRPSGVSRKTSREAQKDAKEFARAKMFYGTGAGTRRKLIRASVEAKRKKSASYGKAFDHYLNAQDLSKHASKATSQRKRVDRIDRNKKRAGYLARSFTGEMGTQAAFVATAVAGVAFLKSPKGQAFVRKYTNAAMSKSEDFKRRQGAKHIAEFLKNQR